MWRMDSLSVGISILCCGSKGPSYLGCGLSVAHASTRSRSPGMRKTKALAERIHARATSVILNDMPELQADLRHAFRIISEFTNLRREIARRPPSDRHATIEGLFHCYHGCDRRGREQLTDDRRVDSARWSRLIAAKSQPQGDSSTAMRVDTLQSALLSWRVCLRTTA